MAVGETWRRLVGKVLLATGVLKSQVEGLTPTQVGVGVRGATESIVIGIQQCLLNLGGSQGWVLLKVDLRNAFNTVSREQILRAALHWTPAAYNFLKFAYSRFVPLFVGESILSSQMGTHQGCPLGPLGFALAIHDLIERITKEGGLMWNIWYLDDGALLGSTDRVVACFNELINGFNALGATVNMAKCEVIGPGGEEFASHFPGIQVTPWVPDSGSVILGTPIDYPMTTGFSKAFWQKSNEVLGQSIQKVTAVSDLQLAHHLIRSCLDGCKVNHLLRASDTYQLEDGIREAENHILGGFEDILGNCMSQPQRVQASLPLGVGGCGLRCPTLIRPAARMAALVGFYNDGGDRIGVPQFAKQLNSSWVLPVITELHRKLGPNFDPLPRWQGDIQAILHADEKHMQQSWWTESLGKKAMTDLLDISSPRDQCRLLEQSNSVGSAFMAITPSSALHTTFSSDLYRLGLKWWLGMPITVQNQAELPPCPGCGNSLDVFGDHLLCCQRINFTKRHSAVQEALAYVLSESGQGFSREVVVPEQGDRQLRPADLLLRAWDGGKDTAVDLTVVHGWQISERSERVTRERWRSFLTRKEREKHLRYDIVCSGAQWSFAAMAFGTWGGLGPEAAKLLHRMCKRAACWWEGDLRASRQEDLRLTFGMTLMKHIWTLLSPKTSCDGFHG